MRTVGSSFHARRAFSRNTGGGLWPGVVTPSLSGAPLPCGKVALSPSIFGSFGGVCAGGRPQPAGIDSVIASGRIGFMAGLKEEEASTGCGLGNGDGRAPCRKCLRIIGLYRRRFEAGGVELTARVEEVHDADRAPGVGEFGAVRRLLGCRQDFVPGAA